MKMGLFKGGPEASPFRQGNFSFAHEWLQEVGTLDALLARLDALRAQDGAHRYVCTLDDVGQCSYTSGHAGQDERLYLEQPDDFDWDDEAQVQAREQEALQHRVRQLGHPDWVQSWSQVCGTLATSGDDVRALVAVNRQPDQLLDDVIYVQRVPADWVPGDDWLVAAAPNGYFSADWDMFQNHAITAYLAANYGYRFFGMGAAWMGWVRDQPLSPDQAGSLVAALRQLYGQDGTEVQEHSGWATLAELLLQRRTLMLGYTENFAETLNLDASA